MFAYVLNRISLDVGRQVQHTGLSRQNMVTILTTPSIDQTLHKRRNTEQGQRGMAVNASRDLTVTVLNRKRGQSKMEVFVVRQCFSRRMNKKA